MTTKSTSVKRVSVLSTGTADAHREHIYGSRKPAPWWIFAGKNWLLDLPIYVFVIEHANGLVLFDAGQDRSIVTDPNYLPKGFAGITGAFLRNLFRFHIGPEDTLTRQLELLGYSASEVTKAVISHLHMDHVGGISEIPQAELVVSQDEWEYMLRPRAEQHSFFRWNIEIPGANWQRISLQPTEDPALAPFTHAYDLMDDGSMMLLPTPGHTPGSLSMLVRSEGHPPALLVGDLCYSLDLLMRDQFPAVGDKKVLRESYAKVRALKEKMPGLLILPAHDPESARLLPSPRIAQAQ